MTDYETIGRYHVALKEARVLVSKRNLILARADGVLKHATEQKPLDAQFIGRRCNFDALHNLLSEAKSVNDELMALVDEVNSLAPLADEAEVKLA